MTFQTKNDKNQDYYEHFLYAYQLRYLLFLQLVYLLIMQDMIAPIEKNY